MTQTIDTAAVFLMQVKAELLQNGWCAFYLEDHIGKKCVMGAVFHVAYGSALARYSLTFSPTIRPAVNKMAQYVRENHPIYRVGNDSGNFYQSWDTCASFNNSNPRGREGVLEMIDWAIADLTKASVKTTEQVVELVSA